MYKADVGAEAFLAGAAPAKSDEAFPMPPWWYCVRGWLLVQFIYRSSINAQVRFFARNISDDHLDVPVGEGTLLSLSLLWRKLWLRRPEARITGVDYSSNMVAGAARRFAKRPNMRMQWGDVGDLPFDAGTFGSANVPNGFHCFPEPEAALKELCRILRPGGTLAANILLHPRGPRFVRWLPSRVNAHYISKGDLNRTFDLDQVLAMVREHGFGVKEAQVGGNTLYLVAEKR